MPLFHDKLWVYFMPVARPPSENILTENRVYADKHMGEHKVSDIVVTQFEKHVTVHVMSADK